MGRPLGQRSGEKDWLWSTKAQLDLRMGTMPYRIIPISREHPLLGSMISPSSMRRKRGYEIYYVISTPSTRSIAWHKGFMVLLVILISCVIFFLVLFIFWIFPYARSLPGETRFEASESTLSMLYKMTIPLLSRVFSSQDNLFLIHGKGLKEQFSWTLRRPY